MWEHNSHYDYWIFVSFLVSSISSDSDNPILRSAHARMKDYIARQAELMEERIK